MTIPAVRGSVTSEEAAGLIKPDLNRLERVVYEWLEKHGPATDKTMQRELRMSGDTQRPRRIALRDKGLVICVGQSKDGSRTPADLWAINTEPSSQGSLL